MYFKNPESSQENWRFEIGGTEKPSRIWIVWDSGGIMCPEKKQTFFYGCDVIVIRNYDVSQLMKLVWEIQTVINFPKKVAGQVRDINQN